MQNKTAKKGISKLWGSRLFWAALSLCAALIVWLYYTSNYGVSQTKVFYGVEVTFTGQDAMRDSLNLVVSNQDVTTVNVTLRGSRRDMARLTSDDIKAVVNLSNITMAGYRAMTYSLTYPSTVNVGNIQESSRSPSTIGLQISKLSTKSMVVSGAFEGNTEDGYMIDASEMVFDPAEITFTGPEEELAQITAARVVVARDDVNATFSAAANYVLLNADGEVLEFDDVQANAEEVSVTVPVSTVKEVALDVTLIDGGGATSKNVVKDIQPKTITVVGDAAVLDGLNSISLANIRLADYETYPAQELPIVLPNGVECLSGETVATVSLDFVGLTSDLFIVTNLSVINAPRGYDATIMDANKVVRVRAPSDIFSQISPNNIRVVADLTDITSTARAPSTVYVDGFGDAGAVGSYPVYVRLEEATGAVPRETEELP